MRVRLLTLGGILAAGVAFTGAAEVRISAELAAPMKITVGGAPIDVEIGHAAPFVGDIDGDGVRDLLVGQFGGGKLRIYRNLGTDAEPRFEDFRFFQAGGKDATVPFG